MRLGRLGGQGMLVPVLLAYFFVENGSIKRMFQDSSISCAIQEAVCFTLVCFWLQIPFFFFSPSLVVISQSIKWLIIDGILWGLWISFINLYSLMGFPWSRHIPLCICTHTYVCMLQSYLCKGNSSLVEACKWNITWLKNVYTGPRVGCMFTLDQQGS